MRKPVHSYSVFCLDTSDLLTMKYMGPSEHRAAFAYYRAVTDPRAAVAMLRKDGTTIARTCVRAMVRQEA